MDKFISELMILKLCTRHYLTKKKSYTQTEHCRPTGEVTIVEFEIFYLKESGKEQYTDFEHYDERDEIKAIEYEIDVDCAIMTKFSNNKCVYFDYNAGHELYTVFFGLEELINEKIYSKTHWFDYPVKQSSIKNWKKRNRY